MWNIKIASIFSLFITPDTLFPLGHSTIVKSHDRNRCTFLIFGGCQGRRTGVGVTTVSNSLILGGWVTKVFKNGDEKEGVEG